MIDDVTPRSLADGLACRGVPLHGGRETRISIRCALGHHAQLEGTALRDEVRLAVNRLGLFDVRLRFWRHVRAACHHRERALSCIQRKGHLGVQRGVHVGTGGDVQPPCAFSHHPQIRVAKDRGKDHPPRDAAMTNQGDVDGELSVALDEFFGAIYGIDNPEFVPLRAVLKGHVLAFFRKHRNARGL